MATYRTNEDSPNIKHIRCPNCGKVRPWDWFRQYLYCWQCRELYPKFKDVLATPADHRRNEVKGV